MVLPSGDLIKAAKPRLVTLKRRSDFQRIRKGSRWTTPAFVLEAMQRTVEESVQHAGKPRFGFTVTKKVGTAVERNRIRRRLKAAVNNVQNSHARPDFDYVLIARRSVLEPAFKALESDLVKALDRVHRNSAQARRPRAAHT